MQTFSIDADAADAADALKSFKFNGILFDFRDCWK